MCKIGSHVGMKGKEMFLGSVKEALSYGADTFMIYTGAPQNTRRRPIEELNIEAGQACMRENGIKDFVVHAPYIINMANTVKPETFQLALDFMRLEIDRTYAMGSRLLVVHPGAHVGAGARAGIDQIARALNEVLTPDTPVYVALETMAGKGSEIGQSFEELAAIYDKVHCSDKLRVCFDTCHTSDAGYDIIHDLDGVLERFDSLLGLSQIAVFHINDSKNAPGAAKDRHENIGFGHIGFEALNRIVHDRRFPDVPKILETPYIQDGRDPKKTRPPYKQEIDMLRKGIFDPGLKEETP